VTIVELGELEDYEPGVPRQVAAGEKMLVAVRVGETLYVLDDRCSHEEFSLSEGEVDLETAEIECARHGAMFRLCDGAPVSLPATKPVAHYDVTDDGGRLRVVVP
jgi:3-phenylpropionate/trans-cinnamate dioxygenase ferredoxin subunit